MCSGSMERRDDAGEILPERFARTVAVVAPPLTSSRSWSKSSMPRAAARSSSLTTICAHVGVTDTVRGARTSSWEEEAQKRSSARKKGCRVRYYRGEKRRGAGLLDAPRLLPLTKAPERQRLRERKEPGGDDEPVLSHAAPLRRGGKEGSAGQRLGGAGPVGDHRAARHGAPSVEGQAASPRSRS